MPVTCHHDTSKTSTINLSNMLEPLVGPNFGCPESGDTYLEPLDGSEMSTQCGSSVCFDHPDGFISN